jgi:hypothetical protein
VCTYTLRLSVLIRLQNTSIANFTAPARSWLVSVVAAATGVPVSAVSLLSATAGDSHTTSRRLLLNEEHDLLRVRLSIAGAAEMDTQAVIRTHIRRTPMMLLLNPPLPPTSFSTIHSIEWAERHSVKVRLS